jgi:hypothetical protein
MSRIEMIRSLIMKFLMLLVILFLPNSAFAQAPKSPTSGGTKAESASWMQPCGNGQGYQTLGRRLYGARPA